ncbi:integrase, catalytic region, zinc finger, CCHC-type containing protein [Tanacetum coccineum]
MTTQHSQLINFVSKFLGTVRFRNDQIAKIMGYGDYQLGNVTISQVYYVEGLGQNLFSVGQLCDLDLEVAFRKHTCYVRNLDDDDLVSKSRDTNLYTISLDNMLKSSLIYNGTEFINQTLRDYYESVGIRHKTLVARTSQQNGVVERWNRTLVEAARTMLIFSIAPLFLWAEVVSTACYTKYCSLIRLSYNKTPYELMHDKKPDLSYLHVFGSLCYLTNDSEDLGKLKEKADIGIFVGYAPAKKTFRIYNKRTRLIQETIHVTFDELTTMASEQFSSGPAPQLMTPGTLCSGLVPNPIPQPPYVPPTKNDWDILFQPIPVDPTGLPVSTSLEQDAPYVSTSSTQEQEHSLIISQGGEESPKTPYFHDDPLHETLHKESTSQGSSSNVRPSHTPFELLGRWTKNHPIENVIGDPSRLVFIRNQVKTDVMWCYFDAFLTLVELKNFKEALLESYWIDAIQEEINEFERLQV